MPKYNVHLYPVARVTVEDVEAATMLEAIAKAEGQVYNQTVDAWIHGGSYADDNALYCLVDVVGDEEHEQTKHFTCEEPGGHWSQEEVAA